MNFTGRVLGTFPWLIENTAKHLFYARRKCGRHGSMLNLNEEKKMSFDLFILTFAFFLRAPIIFSSGNCFMCLTDQLTHLQELSLTAMSLKL